MERGEDQENKWQEFIEREKTECLSQQKSFHQASFRIFITSMSMQAMIELGRLENPLTQSKKANLNQARFLIETLMLIRDKTQGNLTPEEKSLVNEVLPNLQKIYIEEKEKSSNKEMK